MNHAAHKHATCLDQFDLSEDAAGKIIHLQLLTWLLPSLTYALAGFTIGMSLAARL